MAHSATPSRRRLLVVLLLGITGLVVAASPTRAHTEVQRAEPGLASEVSGTVDEVSLLFLDEIQPGGTIVVADENGDPVEGLGDAVLDADGRTMRVSFDSLEEPGTYVVNYSFTALDGDTQDEAYTFTYLGAGTSEGDGLDVALVVVAGLGVVIAVAFVVAMRRRRRALATDV